MKCIYKDMAGNRLFIDRGTYFAKNTKGEIVSKHGLYSMMKDKGLSTKGLKEIYKGNKRNER